MITFYLPVWLDRYDEYFRLLSCHYTFREVLDSVVKDLVAKAVCNSSDECWTLFGKSSPVYYSWENSGKFINETGYSLITGSSGVV